MMYISGMKKKRKNIDLTEDCIQELSIRAIKSPHKNFKNYCEDILEKEAKKQTKKRRK